MDGWPGKETGETIKKGRTMMEGVRVVSVPASDQDRVRDFHTEALSFEPRTEYTLAEVSDGEVRGRVMDDGERFEFEAGIRVVVRESLEVERPR